MLTHPTVDQLHQLGLAGMARAFTELEANPQSAELSHAEWLALLLDREATERYQRRLWARLRYARLRHQACIEDVDYRAARGLDRSLFQALIAGRWIAEAQNLIIEGPAGVGKSWLACALGQKACRDNRSVLYQRIPRMFADLALPGISGFEALCRLKSEENTRHIPVIMLSALDELDGAVRCIEAGAEDYLPKPFNPVLLRARIASCLERKRLLDELRVEKERSEVLLLNILPRAIIARMRQGETVIADRVPEATILFSDLVDFTGLSATLAPEETVKLLGLLFSQFDDLALRCGLETIKTIGDGYMVTSGILERRPESAIAVAEMGLSMLEITETAGRAFDGRLQLRIGIHTGGPMVAGVLGTHKVAFDVWGDAVNTAKRMETYSLPGRVHVSAATRHALGNAFYFEPRGPLDVKGKGPMETYFLYRQ